MAAARAVLEAESAVLTPQMLAHMPTHAACHMLLGSGSCFPPSPSNVHSISPALQCWYINNCCGAANLRHFLLFLLYLVAVRVGQLLSTGMAQLVGRQARSAAPATWLLGSASYGTRRAAPVLPTPPIVSSSSSVAK